MLLKDAIGKLDNQLATCIRHTEEAFTNLEQASAVTCINLEIKWLEMEQDDFLPSEATKALDQICGTTPQPRHPAPRPSILHAPCTLLPPILNHISTGGCIAASVIRRDTSVGTALSGIPLYGTIRYSRTD